MSMEILAYTIIERDDDWLVEGPGPAGGAHPTAADALTAVLGHSRTLVEGGAPGAVTSIVWSTFTRVGRRVVEALQ